MRRRSMRRMRRVGWSGGKSGTIKKVAMNWVVEKRVSRRWNDDVARWSRRRRRGRRRRWWRGKRSGERGEGRRRTRILA